MKTSRPFAPLRHYGQGQGINSEYQESQVCAIQKLLRSILCDVRKRLEEVWRVMEGGVAIDEKTGGEGRYLLTFVVEQGFREEDMLIQVLTLHV